MSTRTRSRRHFPSRRRHVQKPNGVIHPRVEAVGASKYGIVSVDCAKARSKWMLCDFYGNILIAPETVEHTQGSFQNAIAQLRDCAGRRALKEVLVAIERTGNYHQPVKRAFSQAGYETRIVHPFATKQFRLPADPGNKTDDTDLAAIHRATVNGFGLVEQPLDQNARQLRLLVRHRRKLVEKCSTLCCQIREHLHATMPAYAKCFADIWTNKIALPLARKYPSPKAVQRRGVDGITNFLRGKKLTICRPSLVKVLAWAKAAPASDPDAAFRTRLWGELDDDRVTKTAQIRALENDIVSRLVRTPYVLLLAIPGINVVSAADLAAEMGPIEHYANANHITGRAGLFPCRYQSDETDRKDGPLVGRANRRLRTALLQMADNLVKTNHHFSVRAAVWKSQKVDGRLIRVRIAKQFSRVGYALVAGGQLFEHPCCQPRHYIVEKLSVFQVEHGADPSEMLVNINAAIDQLPKSAYEKEAIPLSEKLRAINSRRARGPRPIGEILPEILARLLGKEVQSIQSGDVVSN